MNKKKDEAHENPSSHSNDLPAVDPIPPQNTVDANVEDYQNPTAISVARRRLTVDGIEADLDGIEMEIEPDIPKPSLLPQNDDVFVGVFAGKSSKGYVPYNPRKVNQDWMLIKQDVTTGTLVLGTFDGHGEHGHCISEFICTYFYNALVAHKQFVDNLSVAAVESLALAEKECILSVRR